MSAKKDVEMTFSYPPLEYSLITPVAPRKKSENRLLLPQKIFQGNNSHSHQFIETFYTAGTLKNRAMYRAGRLLKAVYSAIALCIRATDHTLVANHVCSRKEVLGSYPTTP